jgi:RNA polymerase sigma-70 factor (ECF subfamily)
MDGATDSDLIERFRRGDLGAFAELYDRFGDRLYRVAWRMLADPTAAEDAVQEVFLALLKVGSRLERIEDVAAYLFCSIRRAVGRIQQRQSRWQQLGDVECDDIETAAQEREPGDSPCSERVLKALHQLPSEQQEVVILKIEGDLTFAEIGVVLGISPNTAASRYRYALEKLRHKLRDERE